MTRKQRVPIAVFTGNRSEYGLLRKLVKEIELDSRFELQLITSGSHLSEVQGRTVKEIEADGIKPKASVLLSLDADPQPSMAFLTAEALLKISEVLAVLRPKFLIVLGDRYETFAAASAAHLTGIEVVHLHGGETTEGAVDNKLRHAITQLSTWHFTAAEEYKERVVLMGHSSENVFNVGPMAIDQLINRKSISKSEFETLTGYAFNEKNLLVTYHSETLSSDRGLLGLTALLKALERVECNILFTHPNPDEGGSLILERIYDFMKTHSHRSFVFPSLGADLYVPSLYLFDVMVGNSSSGIIEAPITGLPVVNIGDRQSGRLRYGNVVDARADWEDIFLKINTCLALDRQNSRRDSFETFKSPTKEIMQWLVRETIDL